jgi:plastocyanin
MRVSLLLGAALLAAALLACGGGSDDEGSSGTTDEASPYVITIQGMSFSPLQLQVPPGATVTVRNRDSEVHSVTSQEAANAFTPGAVAGIAFDTGLFMGDRTFTVPASAPVGTEVPYYCASHLETMATPNGSVLVTANPSNPPPDDSPGDPTPY